jgi:hypothetical protein
MYTCQGRHWEDPTAEISFRRAESVEGHRCTRYTPDVQQNADAITGRAQQDEDGKRCAGNGRDGTEGSVSAADALDTSARVLVFHESCRHG